MKTERVTLLTSPEFKLFLAAEARREGVSVAELVRSRCERRPSAEEAELAALTQQLQRSVAEARRALDDGLEAANAVLRDLRAARGANPRRAGSAARRRV